ncbi:MAG: GGDEF domain-containing protein [Methyloprofundus sp.]|nr:GGDEF domain-containing protein [Methyloprofundus sp.]
MLSYAPEIEQGSDQHKISSPQEVEVVHVDVPEDIKRAKAWIESTEEIYSVQQGDLYRVVYPILGLKGNVGYLSLTLHEELTSSESMVVASLLSISQNFYSLLEENQKDKLTGLLNRKTFDDNISKIQDALNSIDKVEPYVGVEKRQNNSGKEFWLAIIDIDHFKKINDNFGHVYGDEVLLLLSQVMKQSFRPKDLLFRFGGEEFIAVIQVDNEAVAKTVFERFRVAIEVYEFPRVGQVTISSGATQILEQHAIASDIVGRADQALYHAKENGRNKLFSYEDLVASGVFKETIDEGYIELF